MEPVPLTMPAEWAPHAAVWAAWPSHGHLWRQNLAAAQTEFLELCRAIHDEGRGESLHILFNDAAAGVEAERRLVGLGATLHAVPFGDIWLRDTAPLFVRTPEGLSAVAFGFNGWGGKYLLPGDTDVAPQIARLAAVPTVGETLILEGGSIEVDGEGTCLTTKQCLLNANRNPDLDRAAIELRLRATLGVSRVLWLGDGLINDHTDGHIDTIARFTAPGRVVCMRGEASDPNDEILQKIEADLRGMTDARGRRLHVDTVPSPGAIYAAEGELLPASYLNFYIADSTVVVPTYGSPHDAAAVAAIGRLFPQRRTVGRSARAILSGGGAFHCITQQQPREI